MLYLQKNAGLIILLVILLIILSSIITPNISLGDEFWVLEMIVNQNYSEGLLVEALFAGKIYLPLIQIANLLDIEIDVNNQTAAFSRPGDMLPVFLEGRKSEVFLEERLILTRKTDIKIVEGDIFVALELLELLTVARFKYDDLKQAVYISSVVGKSGKVNINHQPLVDGNAGEENSGGRNNQAENSLFSISNINYHWRNTYEKISRESQVGADSEKKEDSLKTEVGVNLRGKLSDWKYLLGTRLVREDKQELTLNLDRLVLIHDMNQATLKMGKLYLAVDDRLAVTDQNLTGISLSSLNSPLMSNRGHLTNLTGKADPGAEVILYVNGWKEAQTTAGVDGKYIFNNLILHQRERGNQIKVKIIRANGEVEEWSRSIMVFDSILEQGEVNYLVQLGRKKTKDSKEQGVINSIIVWGAGERTTLGFSVYHPSRWGVNYQSLTLNRQFDDNHFFSGELYQLQLNSSAEKKSETGQSFGLNYDYRDHDLRAGLVVDHQAEERAVNDETRSKPGQMVKLYYQKDLTSTQQLETNYLNYLEFDKQVEEQMYRFNYRREEEKWRTDFGYQKVLEEFSNQDSYYGELFYRINSEFYLSNFLGYDCTTNGVEKNQELSLELQGRLNLAEHILSLGAKMAGELVSGEREYRYQFAWWKNWLTAKRGNLRAGVKYIYTQKKKVETYLPLSISYLHRLKTGGSLKLDYLVNWTQGKIDQSFTLNLTGAFNLFSGKPVSTPVDNHWDEVGMVSGSVFRDVNRNGKYDPGEIYLAGIPVKLDSKIQFTDEQGRFSYKQVAAGRHRLSFDFEHLPIALTPYVYSKVVTVGANARVEEELGLYVTGAVDGQVKFVEYSPNYSLKGIRVSAEPGGYQVFTDRNGYYYFDSLPPGRYQIRVDQGIFPEQVIVERDYYQVEISRAGEFFSGLDFIIKPISLDKDGEIEQKDSLTEDWTKSAVDDNEEASWSPKEDAGQIVLKIDLATGRATLNNQSYQLELLTDEAENIWLPVRALHRAFKIQLFWDHNQKIIFINGGNRKLLCDLSRNIIMENGFSSKLSAGIRIENKNAYISIEDLNLFSFSSQQRGQTLLIYLNN